MTIRKWLISLALAVPICSFAVADAPPAIEAKLVVKGLFHPLGINTDGSSRLYITEQDGLIKILEGGKIAKEPFLDIKKSVTAGGECGLLGLAFHPNYKTNGLIYLNYTTSKRGFMDKNPGDLRTVVSEFRAMPGGDKVDPKSERILLTVPQPYSNHNGGQVAFGPDGYLYLGFGDGGNAGDPQNHPQNPADPLGKFMRIDVDRRDGDKQYGIPKDNPFVNVKGTLPEIWASGFRNPWRFSWDPETKMLYTADVGEVSWEEVDIVVKGGNYGWSVFEGKHDNRRSKSTDTSKMIPPIKEYPHTGSKELAKYNLAGNCITGGYVYRGKQIPALQGWYVYGDFQACFIAALKFDKGKLVGDAKLLDTNYPLSTFGVDAAGELYFCDYDRGAIYQIVESKSAAK